MAVTSDGLIVRLPGFKDELIPWDTIGSVSVKKQPAGRRQIALLDFKDKKRQAPIGGVANVFPTPAHIERFVEQVTERLPPPNRTPGSAASGSPISGLQGTDRRTCGSCSG